MSDASESPKPNFVQFSLLLLFAIPSTFCAIYIIYSYIQYSSIRKNFYFEIIIYLTFIVLLKLFFNISLSLSYYARGYVIFVSDRLCEFWQYVDYASSGCIIWSIATFTIERYIIIFHPNYIRSKRQRFFIHYFPIILSNFYINIFYVVGIIILSCDEKDYKRHVCGDPCFEKYSSLSTFNWIFNTLVAVFIIIFGSLILLIRVLWTRRKMQRNLRNWSKNWKMIAQLLGIAAVYALVWLPLSVISLIATFDTKSPFNHTVLDYAYYLTYITDISLPIVVFIFSPEINRRLCRCTPQNSVNIASITRTHHS